MDGKHPKSYASTTPCGFGVTPTGRIQYPFAWKGALHVDRGLNGYGGAIPKIGDACYFDPSSFLTPNVVGRVIGAKDFPASTAGGGSMGQMLLIETMAGKTHSTRAGSVPVPIGNFPWRMAVLSEAEFAELRTLLLDPEGAKTILARAIPSEKKTAKSSKGPHLSSDDHARAIFVDVGSHDALFEAIYEPRKDLTTADLIPNHPPCRPSSSSNTTNRPAARCSPTPRR